MDDLATLTDRGTAVETLQSRHAADLSFTRIGNVLLALGPHEERLRYLYSKEERLRYLHALDRQLPPHIFELGKHAPLHVSST